LSKIIVAAPPELGEFAHLFEVARPNGAGPRVTVPTGSGFRSWALVGTARDLVTGTREEAPDDA
jgi:hypothetical protein